MAETAARLVNSLGDFWFQELCVQSEILLAAFTRRRKEPELVLAIKTLLRHKFF